MNNNEKINELKELKEEILNYSYDSSSDSKKKDDIVEYFFNSVLKNSDNPIDSIKKM